MPTLKADFNRETLRRLLDDFLSAIKRKQDRRLYDELNDDLLSSSHAPRLRRTTILRLAKWCKTDGIYSDAMEVAKEISLLLFGTVLNRDFLGA